jgi:hypothetical protein
MKQAAEDGGDMFLQQFVDFGPTARHFIPQDRTRHSHCCQVLKSCRDHNSLFKKVIYCSFNYIISRSVYIVYNGGRDGEWGGMWKVAVVA